jgi:hypothetical protein
LIVANNGKGKIMKIAKKETMSNAGWDKKDMPSLKNRSTGKK